MSERAGTGVADRLYALLSQIYGTPPPLTLVGWDGTRAGASEGPVVHVVSRRAVRRLLWSPGEIGVARAYVAGEIEIEGDVTDALRAATEFGSMSRTKDSLESADRREILRTAVLLGAVGPAPRAPVEEYTPGRDRAPEGRAVFAAGADPALVRDLLGSTGSYSCGWWDGVDTLDAAQEAKYDRVCRVLELREGSRMLDVGAGWGGLIVHAAEHYGVTAVGMVGSSERAEVVRARLAERGLDDRLEVRSGDHADVEDSGFDAVVDLESLTHTDRASLDDYAARVRALLLPGGRLLQQQTTIPVDVGDDTSTFLRSYVYPDGPLTPISWTLDAWEAAGLELRRVESVREQYPPTLRAWGAQLDAHWDRAVEAVGEQRARVWRFSLALAAVRFERGSMSLYQALAVRPHSDGRAGLRSV